MDRVTATAPIVPAHAIGHEDRQQRRRKRDGDKPTANEADGHQADSAPADGDKGQMLDDYA